MLLCSWWVPKRYAHPLRETGVLQGLCGCVRIVSFVVNGIKMSYYFFLYLKTARPLIMISFYLLSLFFVLWSFSLYSIIWHVTVTFFKFNNLLSYISYDSFFQEPLTCMRTGVLMVWQANQGVTCHTGQKVRNKMCWTLFRGLKTHD